MTEPRPARSSAATLSTSHAQANGVRAVMAQLQVALHTSLAALLALTLWRIQVETSGQERLWSTAVSITFGIVYAAGTVAVRHRPVGQRSRALWLLVVSALWALIVVQIPEAAYLAFPLYFVALFLTKGWRAVLAVSLLVATAIIALGMHRQWSVAGVVGPIIGAIFALGVSAGVRALNRQSEERQVVIEELIRTRAELARQQHDAGRDAERARLAGEIHDTVAQGLSSIGMLLHAAERADPQHSAIEQIRLARSVANENLVETRRLIAALRPAPLDGTTVDRALETIKHRLETENPGVSISVDCDPQAPSTPLKPELAAALVRIAQEGTTNAIRHGRSKTIDISLRTAANSCGLEISDDGQGFDVDAPRSDSAFGLEGMKRRIEDLDGTFTVDSAPGRGTRICATLPHPQLLDGRISSDSLT